MIRLLLLATLLVGGSDVMTNSFADDQAKIAKVLEGIRQAAEKMDIDRLESFHAYGSKFTKFEDDGLGRQDAAAGKKGERDSLVGVKAIALKLEDVKIDVFGPAAVTTFVLRYTVEAGKDKISAADRATMVFARDGGTWKIVHEHLSPLKSRP